MTHKEDIKSLVGKWMMLSRQTLIASHRLSEMGEDGTRSAVNRAYYAAYYALTALLQTVEIMTSKHQGAIATFEKEFVKTGQFPKEMSAFVRRLFKMRMEDDYVILEPISDEEADLAIKLSEQFINNIATFLVSQGWLVEETK